MLCWEAVEEVLSSKKTYSKFCTTEVLNAFKKWCEKHKEDEVIDKHLLTLTREVDTVVKDAVTKVSAQRRPSWSFGGSADVRKGFIVPDAVRDRMCSGAIPATRRR